MESILSIKQFEYYQLAFPYFMMWIRYKQNWVQEIFSKVFFKQKYNRFLGEFIVKSSFFFSFSRLTRMPLEIFAYLKYNLYFIASQKYSLKTTFEAFSMLWKKKNNTHHSKTSSPELQIKMYFYASRFLKFRFLPS